MKGSYSQESIFWLKFFVKSFKRNKRKKGLLAILIQYIFYKSILIHSHTTKAIKRKNLSLGIIPAKGEPKFEFSTSLVSSVCIVS